MMIADGATTLYIGAISLIAQFTGASYVLFPELSALSHGILKRPHGAWGRAPVLLVVTPVLTGLLGTVITRELNYGFASVLLTVGASLLVIRLLKSPIAPAISAGLLPLTLGQKSWWYPPSLIVGLGALALIGQLRRWTAPATPPIRSIRDLIDETLEEAPADYSWAPFFFLFLIAALLLVDLTGWRFLLYPPLVVIGYEMFAHTAECPWADRPFALTLACTLSALAGLILVTLFGAGPLAAVCSIIAGVGLLRAFDVHLPPALAVSLLPLVIPDPSYRYPLAVGAGTALLIVFFLAWRYVRLRSRPSS
jgi:hypothetical protein